MKEKILEMIALIKTNRYDQEVVHQDYDRLLQEYITNLPANLELKDLMIELINLEKDFWYA